MPTLFTVNDLYFDRAISLHKCILSTQLMRTIAPISLNEKSHGILRKMVKNMVAFKKIIIGFFNFLPVHDGAKGSFSSIDSMFVVMCTSLFNRFTNACNGLFTIGSIIIFVNPKPIEKHMNGLLMVEAEDQATLASPTVWKLFF